MLKQNTRTRIIHDVLHGKRRSALQKLPDVKPCNGNGKQTDDAQHRKSAADVLRDVIRGEPILLVGKQLTTAQSDYLKSFVAGSGQAGYQSFEFSIIGGTGAVPETVADQLKQYGSVERVSGSDRFATSIAVAERFFPGSNDTVVIANGMNFPDGLSGGPVATAYGGPLILVIDKVNDHAVNYFKDKDAYRLVIMGGTGVIADDTANKIFGGAA